MKFGVFGFWIPGFPAYGCLSESLPRLNPRLSMTVTEHTLEECHTHRGERGGERRGGWLENRPRMHVCLSVQMWSVSLWSPGDRARRKKTRRDAEREKGERHSSTLRGLSLLVLPTHSPCFFLSPIDDTLSAPSFSLTRLSSCRTGKQREKTRSKKSKGGRQPAHTPSFGG